MPFRSSLAAGCLLAAGCGPVQTGRAEPRSVTSTAVVTRIVDGDTLVLRGQGRVRLIGIDAPETWLRRDCFGTAATRALRRLTPPGSTVRAAGDVRQRDRYGRRLLFLWTRRGVFVNAALVRAGFARARALPPDTSRAGVLREAEEAARRARAGLWRSCAARGVTGAPRFVPGDAGSARSAERASAVHGDVGAGDLAGHAAGQQHDRVGDVLGT